MATRLREGPFREVPTDGKKSLFVSHQIADHSESMKLLADNGLRPITYREALVRAPELIEKLRGRWFWLDGKGIREDGTYAYDANGELAKPTGKETIKKKIHVFPGDQPLFLSVFANYTAEVISARFGLYGDIRYHVDADQIVVGVRTPLEEAEESMEEGRAALARLKRSPQK